jgi:hypothetical protein
MSPTETVANADSYVEGFMLRDMLLPKLISGERRGVKAELDAI